MSKKTYEGHLISRVLQGSIAEELGIKPGDRLLTINEEKIDDIFDYRYLINDESIVLEILSAEDGDIWEYEIDKEYNEELGLEFSEVSGLMDKYHSCRNKCIFCFIDQMPKGMRETLYFKDDDARLSFLQGNYITLTNLSQKDVDRICFYKLSPINISIHTTNPKLRCEMLNNRFAGESLNIIKKLVSAGIEVNFQIVLCKGINDGEELKRTLTDIEQYMPNVKSLSVVPVGLTKFREGLFKLEPFNGIDALKVIDIIEEKQQYYLEKWGCRTVYASDEWYLIAGRELPKMQEYENFPQLENGVGMLRSLICDVESEIDKVKTNPSDFEFSNQKFVCVTGKLAFPTIEKLTLEINEEFGTDIEVCVIRNDFFGENITVTGLITGGDIISQLKKRFPSGLKNCYLIIPSNMLKADKAVFLDDISIEEVETALQTKCRIVKSSGSSFVGVFLKNYVSSDYSEELNKYEIDRE